MKKDGKKRVWFLLIFCTAVFAAFLVRLYWMQFTMADHYAKKLEQASQTSYTVRIPAARGSIVDRSGTALVQDDTVYDLALCVPAPPDTEMAQTLQTLKELDLGGKDVETQLAAFCSAVSAGELPLAENLTQAQCQSLLAAGLPQSGAVRLTARGTRTAVDGTLAPQLLGGVGAMSAEQWAQKKAQGLAMDESIGQWGLEAAWEDALRGRAGSLKVTVDRSSGGRTETIQSTPQAGDTLHLYLDADLQRTLRSALQQQIETLQATKPEGKGKEARAGAAVVVDVQTGGVLAAVSLPDYDLANWRQNYAALATAQGAPLVNRVLNGQYAPGSAFKPAVAASALAAGIITPQSTVNCGGRYTYYAGYQPRCLQLGHRGAVSMVTALRHSCNIYFYDVGRRLGVDTFSATAQQLGLGAPCGTELPETTGRLTWSTDENYQAGLALMAAIGQGNTSVSPLQLAAYAGALARDGQRPALHFAQSTTDAAGNITWQAQPEVLAQAPGGAAVFAPIREGMAQMAQTLRTLRESPIPLACKTGSPQRSEGYYAGSTYKHYTNAAMIAYGPAEDAEIALGIVIEAAGAAMPRPFCGLRRTGLQQPEWPEQDGILWGIFAFNMQDELFAFCPQTGWGKPVESEKTGKTPVIIVSFTRKNGGKTGSLPSERGCLSVLLC